MPATTKKPIKIVPNTIKTIPKVPLSPISKSKSFQEKLNDIQNNIDINIDDIPEDLLDIWDELQEDITPKLISKNYKLWLTIFTPFILPGIINGMSGKPAVPQPVVTVQEPAPDPKQIVNFAQKYFAEHGLELCKSLTKTDLNSMKQDLINNWGKGPDAFSKAFQDSYPVSKARLENIYRSERHIAEYHGVLERAKIADHKYKQWRAVGDERSCDLCMSHDMETVPINEPFSNGEMTATGHPQCRCSMVTYSDEDYNEMKEDSAYLDDVVNTIKLNYNCPDSEKLGSGPGSCGGGKTNKSSPEKEAKENNTHINIATSKNDMIQVRAKAFQERYPTEKFDAKQFEKNWKKSDEYKEFEPLSNDVQNEIISSINKVTNDIPAFRGATIILSKGHPEKGGVDAIADAYTDESGVIIMHESRDTTRNQVSGPEDKNYLCSGSLYDNTYAGTFAHEMGHVISFKDKSVIQRAGHIKSEENDLQGRLSRMDPKEIAAECESIFHGGHLNKFNDKTQKAILYVVTGSTKLDNTNKPIFHENTAYLADAFETIKLNYNCPDSEKVGSGPGSCSGGNTSNLDKVSTLKNKIRELEKSVSEGKSTFDEAYEQYKSIQKELDLELEKEKLRNPDNAKITNDIVTDPEPITPYKALSDYQNYAYTAINDYLRKTNHVKQNPQQTKNIQNMIKTIDSEMENNPLKSDKLVFRADNAGISSDAFEKTGLTNIFKDTFGKESLTLEDFIKNHKLIDKIREKLVGYEYTEKAYLSTGSDKENTMNRFLAPSRNISKYGVTGLINLIVPKGTPAIRIADYTGLEDELGGKIDEYLIGRDQTIVIDQVYIRPADDNRLYLEYNAHIKTNEQKQNSEYLEDVTNFIKLNYKCKAGTVDDSNKCGLEQNTTSLTDRYDDKNTSSDVIAGYVRNDNKLVNSILSGDYDLSEKDKNRGLEKIRLLDNIFKDKLLPEKEITYRGISKSNIKNLPDNWNKIGNVISPGTFLSTSRSRSEAEGFITGGSNDDSILIKLILPRNTNAINVSDFVPKTSAYAYSFDENEVLVDRNTEFKVVDYRIENSRNMGELHIATWEAIPDEQKQNSSYLADAFETIKLNYNCPDSEKIGSGPGSCGGSKPDTKKEILEGQENKQEATLTNLPLGKPDFSGVSIQISKDVGLTNEKYRQELGDNVVGALDAYRRTDYIGINSYLRNGNTKGQDINSIKDQIKLLDSAFIKKTSEPITTFRVLRGQDIINKYQPGSKIDEKAYVSTTISGGVGFFGADSENAISLQIEVPKGTPFVDMSKATTGVENELLLPRNGKLLVKEVRDVTKKLYNLDENGNMVPKDVTRKYARVEYIPENDNNVNSSFQEISSTFNSELGGFHITEYKAPDAKPLRIMSQDKADNAKLLEAIQDLPPETLPAQFTVMKMPNNVPAKYYAKLDTIGVSKKLSSAEMTKAIKDVMTTIKRNERLNEVALLQDAYNTIKLNYRCEENPPGSGNFKCDITKQSDKQLDKTNKLRLKEIKTKIKEVEAKNQAIRDQMDKVPRDSPKWKDLQKQNSVYLEDVTNFIKLNYKCKAGTVDDSNKCKLENSDVPETRTFHEENIKSKILSLNDSKYPKDAVFRSKSRSNMTKNVELDVLNNDDHVKILSDNIDKLHYQCDNLKIPRLRGIVADKNTKAGLASMADGILAVTPDMFRNDPDSEVDLRLSRNQERLNYINNKLNLLESFIQSDKEKWTKNNPSLVNSGMKFEESTFYKTGYPWPKEINEYKSEKNNIMARINDLNTKKTNALIYTWKPGMPDSEKPFGASEYFPFEQSPKLLLDHEFGHHIHQLYGVKNAKSYAEPPLEKKIDQIYKKSEKDGTLIVPSKYAASDHQEWFAESYSLYVNGRDDLVTPGLIDLFKKIGVKHDN